MCSKRPLASSGPAKAVPLDYVMVSAKSRLHPSQQVEKGQKRPIKAPFSDSPNTRKGVFS
jgi:hypothetical protein